MKISRASALRPGRSSASPTRSAKAACCSPCLSANSPTRGSSLLPVSGAGAARLAGLTAIPAYVRSDTDDAAALELALIENAAREDLTPIEEARTLSTLIDDIGLTQTALAKRIGRSRSDLANTLRLLDLPHDML